MLKEDMAYATHLVMASAPAPSITWADDLSQLSYKDITLSLPKFRHGIQELLKLAWTQVKTITGEIDIAVNIPHDYVEDMTLLTRQKLWLDSPQFKSQYLLLFESLINHSTYPIADLL